jgi:DNA-binding XRE family transcriptional regulator
VDHESIRGQDLKIRRIRAGIRQYRIAQELGIAPTTMNDWENERKPIPPRQCARIIAAIERLSGYGMAGVSDDSAA